MSSTRADSEKSRQTRICLVVMGAKGAVPKIVNRCYPLNSNKRLMMAKSRDARKDIKKKPLKSIQEKRKAKQERKPK